LAAGIIQMVIADDLHHLHFLSVAIIIDGSRRVTLAYQSIYPQ